MCGECQWEYTDMAEQNWPERYNTGYSEIDIFIHNFMCVYIKHTWNNYIPSEIGSFMVTYSIDWFS